jgi:hypothetical protein
VGQPSGTPNRVVLRGVDIAWFDPNPSEFGASVWARGEGSFDLFVAAPGHLDGQGALWVFRDADLDLPNGLPATGDTGWAGGPAASRSIVDADVWIIGDSSNDRLGERLFPCADLDGDRIPDLAIGIPHFQLPAGWPIEGTEPVPSLAGAVLVVLSELLAPKEGRLAPTDVGRVYWGTTVGQGAGAAVACDHDLDGDGVVDLAIGSPWAREGVGRVDIVSGDPLPGSGPLSAAAGIVSVTVEPARLSTGVDARWFGISLAALPPSAARADATLLVGAAGTDGGAGRVYVTSGYEAGRVVERASITAPAGRDTADHFGRWMIAAPLSDDLLDDVAIGAPDYKGPDRNDYDTGRVWVFRGADVASWQDAVSADDAAAQITGQHPFQRVGRALTAGDVDEDGRSELLIPTRDDSDPGS